VGLALEQHGAVSAHLTELARHFTEAAALGEVDKAVDDSRRAGEAAIDDLAYEEAALHFERALDTLQLREPVDEDTYATLVMAAGNALHQIGEPPGRDLLHRAEQLGRGRDDIELLARVSMSLSANLWSRQNGGIDQHAVDLAEHVLRHALGYVEGCAETSHTPDAMRTPTSAS
jgi:hypothetical protein